MTVVWPAKVILICPPHEQINLHELSNVGMPPVNTAVLPVIQGETVIGMQGMGVRTPIAAAVAAATVGLARLMQVPKVGMLAMGVKFMMVPTCRVAVTMALGVTISEEGAAPKVQDIMAEVTQTCGMCVRN